MKKSLIGAISLCLALSLFVGCTDKAAGSSSKSSEDITVTVYDKYTFSLDSDIADTISRLRSKDLVVVDAKFNRVYDVDNSGKICYGKTSLDLKSDLPVVLVAEDSVPNEALATMGYMKYFFAEKRFTCNSLSLLKGWNGSISDVTSYLSDENSFTEDDFIFSVFKNGKIIPASEIWDKYGDMAAEAAAYGSLSEYWKANGIDHLQDEKVNRLPYSFVGIKLNDQATCSDKYFAVYFALLDLAAEYQDGNISNFGLLSKDSRDYVTITIGCSLDNYMALKKAEKYREQ